MELVANAARSAHPRVLEYRTDGGRALVRWEPDGRNAKWPKESASEVEFITKIEQEMKQAVAALNKSFRAAGVVPMVLPDDHEDKPVFDPTFTERVRCAVAVLSWKPDIDRVQYNPKQFAETATQHMQILLAKEILRGDAK